MFLGRSTDVTLPLAGDRMLSWLEKVVPQPPETAHVPGEKDEKKEEPKVVIVEPQSAKVEQVSREGAAPGDGLTTALITESGMSEDIKCVMHIH